MASELLYGKKALYYQSNCAALLERSDQVKTVILQQDAVSASQAFAHVSNLESELSLIPVGYDKDLVREKMEVESLGRQIADIRQL